MAWAGRTADHDERAVDASPGALWWCRAGRPSQKASAGPGGRGAEWAASSDPSQSGLPHPPPPSFCGVAVSFTGPWTVTRSSLRVRRVMWCRFRVSPPREVALHAHRGPRRRSRPLQVVRVSPEWMGAWVREWRCPGVRGGGLKTSSSGGTGEMCICKTTVVVFHFTEMWTSSPPALLEMVLKICVRQRELRHHSPLNASLTHMLASGYILWKGDGTSIMLHHWDSDVIVLVQHSAKPLRAVGICGQQLRQLRESTCINHGNSRPPFPSVSGFQRRGSKKMVSHHFG